MPTLSSQRSRTLIASLALFLASSGLPVSVQAAKSKKETRTVEVGAFQVSVALDRNWSHEANKEQGYALFRYADSPNPDNASDIVTIGVFRTVVPKEAQKVDRHALAQAYGVDDVSGAVRALLKNVPKMTLESKRGEIINGGTLINFLEAIEAKGHRKSSTMYVRVSVFFPAAYAGDGVIFVIAGREQFDSQQYRPDELDRMKELVAGIR